MKKEKKFNYYYDEEKPAEEYIIKKSNSHDFFKKKVICIDTNEEYESAICYCFGKCGQEKAVARGQKVLLICIGIQL